MTGYFASDFEFDSWHGEWFGDSPDEVPAGGSEGVLNRHARRLGLAPVSAGVLELASGALEGTDCER